MRRTVTKSNRIRPLGRAGARRLDRARSLGGLVARAARARALAKDPTGALERATRLVEAARRARKLCRKRLRTLHIGPNGRVVYARAKSAADLQALTVELGDLFAQSLAGTGLVVTVVTRTAPPPPGALRIEDFRRQAKAAAQRVRAASAALALGGFAAAAAATPAHAEEQSTPMQRRDSEVHGLGLPVAALTTQTDWACGFAPPERIWDVRIRAGDAAVTHVAVADPQAEGAAEVRDFVRGIDAALLHRDPLAIVGPNGERIVALVRYADPSIFDLRIAACAPPPPPAPEAPPAAPEPAFSHAYREIGADYIDRTEQDGLVASGVAQWSIAPNSAANVQAAIGQIDGHLAVGGQVAAQHFMPVGARSEAAIGAFLSAVTSKAPNDEDLGIYRAGAGVSVVGEETQIVVRGGYAMSDGFADKEGGFIRVEAGWFPIERLSIDAFAEHDPITGAGAGLGVTARPFSDVFSNLMIDADAAWHEDGEESFRIGLRWLIGEAARNSERDRRRQRGMTPYLPQEFERLPDDQSSNTAPYGGEAEAPASAASTAAFLE